MQRHLGSLVLLVMLASGGGLVAWRAVSASTEEGAASTAAEQRPVPVQVAAVERGVLRDVRVLSGTLEAATRFVVAAKVGGRIESLPVDLGDRVRRGQIIAMIDDDEFVQSVLQADAELAVREAEQAQTEAELERVQRDFDRLQSLAERGIVSDTEMDEIAASLASQKAAVALAAARVRQAKATKELAEIDQRYTSVQALWEDGPDTAIVSARLQDAGNTIDENDPIVRVVALDPLKAVVSVTEADYTRLRVGQVATLTTDGRRDEVFTATVQRIAPIFETASRQARVELEVENADGLLRPGMFVRVRIVLGESEETTVAPLAAVVRRSGEDVVFRVSADGASAVLTPVELGIAEGERVEIVRPPLDGRVVVLGQHLLQDGAAITIAE